MDNMAEMFSHHRLVSGIYHKDAKLFNELQKSDFLCLTILAIESYLWPEQRFFFF